MNWGVIRVCLIIFLTFLLPGIYTRGPSTCKDLDYKITSREDEIETLRLTLEEYKLASDEKKEKPDDCNEYETCSKCLSQRTNPSCGWCILQNRCSFQQNCRGSELNSPLWTVGMERCPKIRAIKPPHIAAGTVEMLQIAMLLPEYDGMFLCSFEILGKKLLTKGIRTNTTEDGITCASPPAEKIPEIPVNIVNVTVKLSVRIPHGSNLASTTNFIIYDCGRYTSCSECAASPFPCAWCVGGNKCTHNIGENCKNDIIVFSKAVNRPTIREGPGYCSRLIPPPESKSNEIFVPSGSKWRIVVKLENLLSFQVMTRFICEFKGAGRVVGQLLADTVYCDEKTFKLLDRNPISNVSFALYWGGGQGKFDNVQNLHLVVYHCALLASSCSECLDLRDEFNCGWCEETNTCTIANDCGESGWMDKKQKCTKPQIISFYPKSGLSTQKTNITIKGVNFGKHIEDIERVQLLNEANDVISECKPWSYHVKQQSVYEIICELDVPDSNGGQGSFEVKIADKFVAFSDEKYRFVDPSLARFEPIKGIKSGGTYLKIEGSDLDAGNDVKVFIGDLPCNIISRDSTTIRCVTSPSSRTRSSDVRVIFDSEEKKLSAFFFYVEDPFVRSVRSETGSSGPVGTLSGGSLIFVEGEYFDHVPNAYIYIIVDDIEYPGGCRVEYDKRMECISPRLPVDVLSFCSEEGFMEFDYGFRMGDVQDVRNISLNKNFEKFRIYPDPFFMPFSEEGMTKIYKSDYLIMNGRYLDTVFDERDIIVHIGEEECVLRSLSRTQLICKPPAKQPKGKDGDERKLPEVVVKIYEKHEFFLGFLRYSDKE